MERLTTAQWEKMEECVKGLAPEILNISDPSAFISAVLRFMMAMQQQRAAAAAANGGSNSTGSPGPPFNPADLPPLPPGVSEATLRTLSTGLGATGLGASALESALGHMLPGGLGSLGSNYGSGGDMNSANSEGQNQNLSNDNSGVVQTNNQGGHMQPQQSQHPQHHQQPNTQQTQPQNVPPQGNPHLNTHHNSTGPPVIPGLPGLDRNNVPGMNTNLYPPPSSLSSVSGDHDGTDGIMPMGPTSGALVPLKQKKPRAKHPPDPNAPKTWHPCTYCDKVFQRRDKLTRHILTHTHEKPHVCPDCGKGFGRVDKLKLHQRLHTGEARPDAANQNALVPVGMNALSLLPRPRAEKKHWCEECGKGFTRLDKLRIHNRIHTGEKPYTCQYCQEAFHRWDQKKRHEQAHEAQLNGTTGALVPSGPAEKKHFCPECGKGFTRIEKLRIHNRIHTGVRPYACRHCQKTFYRWEAWKRHETRHTKEKKEPSLPREKNHICDVCSKAFTFAFKLRIHQRLHTGERPYQCRFCEKTFYRGDHWKKHQQSHINKDLKANANNALVPVSGPGSLVPRPRAEKKHFCTECGKGFTRADKLRIHNRLHTGERPYTCQYCQETFYRWDYWKKHERGHVGENGDILPVSQPPSHSRALVPRDSSGALVPAEKKFFCQECGKGFTRMDKLRIHNRLHTGVRWGSRS